MDWEAENKSIDYGSGRRLPELRVARAVQLPDGLDELGGPQPVLVGEVRSEGGAELSDKLLLRQPLHQSVATQTLCYVV